MPDQPIDLPKPLRQQSIASLQRYFAENFAEPLGDLPAGLLLNFILEELGPAVYNHAVADAQTRLQQRLEDLPGELYANPFPYWPKQDSKRRPR